MCEEWNEFKEWLKEFPEDYVLSVWRLIDKMEDLEKGGKVNITVWGDLDES